MRSDGRESPRANGDSCADPAPSMSPRRRLPIGLAAAIVLLLLGLAAGAPATAIAWAALGMMLGAAATAWAGRRFLTIDPDEAAALDAVRESRA